MFSTEKKKMKKGGVCVRGRGEGERERGKGAKKRKINPFYFTAKLTEYKTKNNSDNENK